MLILAIKSHIFLLKICSLDVTELYHPNDRGESRHLSLSRFFFESIIYTTHPKKEQVDPENIRYFNRLSDALFVWSRWVSNVLGDEENIWEFD